LFLDKFLTKRGRVFIRQIRMGNKEDMRVSYYLAHGTDESIQEVINLLDEDNRNEEYILTKVDQHRMEKDKSIYARLLKVLTHLDFENDESEKIWNEIMENRANMAKAINRPISFRVALLDYFMYINKKLENPKIIEIRLFFETEKLVMVDELTGLYNKRYYENAIKREINQAMRYRRSMAVVMMDVDDFKKINDVFGHQTGDWVLKKLGDIMNRMTRSEDSACRVGGEEFILILPEGYHKTARIVAEKIRVEFNNIIIGDKNLSLSGGIAVYPDDGDTIDELVKIADKNLYTAKWNGKNRIISNVDDKRAEIRFPVQWRFSLHHKEEVSTVVTNDVSLGGISFDSIKSIFPDEEIVIKLGEDLNPELKGMEIRLKVQWVKKDGKRNNHYTVGGEFINLPKEYKMVLAKVLYNNQV